MKKLLLLFASLSFLSCGSSESQITSDEIKAKSSQTQEKSVQGETELVSNESTDDKSSVVEEGTEGVVIKITTAEFKQLVFDFQNNKEWKFAGDKPCIVDFYADWCGPCKMIAPILSDLAKEYSGKINIYKVNTDQERELAGAFGIRGIPSILYCPATGQPQMSTGASTREEYKKNIESLLLNTK